MTRRKQSQPMQCRSSEGSQEFADEANESERTDRSDDVGKLSLPLEPTTDSCITALHSSRKNSLSEAMVAEGRRSPTPPTSGTEPEGPKSSDSPSSAASAGVINDDDKSSSSSLSMSSSNPCLKRPSGSSYNVDEKSNKVKSDGKVVDMPTERSNSAATKAAVESAISDLVDKYSLNRGSVTSEELMTSSSSGRSSSVAQLESFVASVAVVGRKVPTIPAATAQPTGTSLPVIQNIVATPSSLHSSNGSAATSSGKHSKPSRSKSSAGGTGQSSKSGGEKARLKSSSAAAAATAPSNATGVVPIQGPPNSALSLYPPQMTAGFVGSFIPVPVGPVQMCSPVTANEQPLDLSSKSSRQNETKYLNPDTITSAGQGLSSLISLERQFGKGSNIFDRIGTKAWAAPYCAAAIRLGLPTFPANATTVGAPNMPFADTPSIPGSHVSGSHSGTTPKSAGNGRSSDRIPTTGSSTKDADTPRSTHPRRPPMQSPSDATSLLPWVQMDQKKSSISALPSSAAATSGTTFPHSSASTTSAAQTHHQHTNFRCSCGASMESLYELTLHIQKTGHSPAPPPTVLAVPPSDGESTGNGSVTGSASSSGGSGHTGGTGSSATSSSKPYEYSKLVRGQDVWLSGGGERTRRSILRCIECGESFRSLPELTVHMVHTRHYTNIVGSAGGAGIGSSDIGGSSGTGCASTSNQHQQRKHASSAGGGDKQPSTAAGTPWMDRSKHSPSRNGSKQLHARRHQLPEVQTSRPTGQRQPSTAFSPAASRDRPSSCRSQKDSSAFGDREPRVTENSDHNEDGKIHSSREDDAQSSVFGSRSSSPADSVVSIGGRPSAGSTSWMSPAAAASAGYNEDDVDIGHERQTEAGHSIQTRRHQDEDDDGSTDDYRDRRPRSVGGGASSRTSTPVDCRQRTSPDGMSAEKKTLPESTAARDRPLSPNLGCMSSLSAIKAMESFIHSSFGLTAPPAGNPRSTSAANLPHGNSRMSDRMSTASPNRTKYLGSSSVYHDDADVARIVSPKRRPESTSTPCGVRQLRMDVDNVDRDDKPTDLTSTKTGTGGKGERSQDNFGINRLLDRKISPLSGMQDADSSTPCNAFHNGDDLRGKTATSATEEDDDQGRDELRTVRTRNDTDESVNGKFGRNKKRLSCDTADDKSEHWNDVISNKSARYDDHGTKRVKCGSPSDEVPTGNSADEDRPTSSTSFGRRSALESLQGLVYGQSLSSGDHPLDNLQRLLYGGAAAAAAAAAAAGTIPMPDGLLEHSNTFGAFPSGTTSVSTAGGLLNGLPTGLPFGSSAAAAFHSSLLGPQTLILVNPIVTVMPQNAGSSSGSPAPGGTGPALSITVPPPMTSGAAMTTAADSSATTPINHSLSSSSSKSSRSSSGVGGDLSESPPSSADVHRSGSSAGVGSDSSLSASVPPRVYRCRACRRKFSSKGSYRYHLSRCHLLASTTSSPKNAADQQQVVSERFNRSDKRDLLTSSTVSSAGSPYGCVPLDGNARIKESRYYNSVDAEAK